ncbi:hypothetical protein [Aliikangiella sp. G2MR2-5]|uniref:hypothetical protein n=1 Tax=Aliikangiella sp. G2MR2-5 TaxID=2788943 RepID=UPI0018ABF665|nr:hypothetical protein [Aliikangiella sp. G2MR2-5]
MKNKLLYLLTSSSNQWLEDSELDNFNIHLRKAFLDQFSATPDNNDTAKYLRLGHFCADSDDGETQGLIMGEEKHLVSTLLWTAFGDSEVPAPVIENYPEISKEQWNQVIRIAQIAVQLFENEK